MLHPFRPFRLTPWRTAPLQDTTPLAAGALWTVHQSGSPAANIVNPDGYDPYDFGTFWGKWLARNPYHGSYRCRVYEGFVGDDIADMRVRHYIIDRVEGPTNGQVTLVAKDLFSIIEAQKAVAPVASQGELFADISAVAGSATLSPAGIGDEEYPSAGNVAIGDELITFTRVGDVLTLTARGAFNTTADAHKQEDLVQLVLTYTTQRAVDIVYDLLLNYTSLTTADLLKAQWDIFGAQLTSLYTARIAKPVAVSELIGELCEQVGFTLWPDVETGHILLRELRATAPTATVDDEAWIVEDSLSLKRQSERRASQVWVYYAQINPTIDIEERKNFHSRAVTIDLDAESADQYGTPAIKEIFSRWIPQFGRSLALETGDRVIAMFRDPPLQATFKLHASRSGEIGLAQYFLLQTAEVQDDTGAVLPVTMAAVEIEQGENELGVVGQQVAFAAFSASPNDRTIYIENESLDLNLRSVHDSLYAAPTGTETVTFVVVAGIKVGSASATGFAVRTGDWPAGVSLSLVNHGRIQGKGGNGGNVNLSTITAFPGQTGGTALKAEYAIAVDNLDGQVWGGGGGSGGIFASVPAAGNGGAGFQPGSAGAGGVRVANAGTTEVGGARVNDTPNPGYTGAGGGPGLAAESSSLGPYPGPIGSSGGAGFYIVGNAFVTWVNNGDRRGSVS